MSLAQSPHRHEAAWRRLSLLVDRVSRKGPRSLTPDEAEELGRLYRWATADLAKGRTEGLPEATLRWLNELCAKTHALLYRPQTHRTPLRAAFRELPVRAWEMRGPLLISLASLVGGWLVGYEGVTTEPTFARLLVPNDGSGLSARMLADRTVVGFLWGGFLGVGSPLALAWTGAGMGAACALTFSPWDLLGRAAAHAAAGIGALLLAGAVGLHVGWSLIAPGASLRKEAFFQALSRGGPLLGLALCLNILSFLLEWGTTSLGLPRGISLASGGLIAAGLVVLILLGRKRSCLAD